MDVIKICIMFFSALLTHQVGCVIEVKVVIKRCSDDYISQSEDNNLKERQPSESSDLMGEDEHFPGIVKNRIDLEKELEMDEPEYPFHLTRCQRKLVISLWIKNRVPTGFNSTEEDEQLIYIDHGYDALTGRIVKLLSPVTIRFHQQPVLQAYPFRNIHVVNGLSHEEIINKDETPNYAGCDDTSSSHPTCSYAYKKGKPIPYSQGFCCYCTPSGKPPARLLAQAAQASMHRSRNETRIHEAATSPAPKPNNGAFQPPVMEGNSKMSSFARSLESSPSKTGALKDLTNSDSDDAMLDNLHNRLVRREQDVSPFHTNEVFPAVDERKGNGEEIKLRNIYDPKISAKASRRKRRSLQQKERPRRHSLTLQPRGGQDCNSDTPVSVDPDKYLSSAHCLRLHDIWYTVNAIQMPRLRHTVELQVYAKKDLPDGSQRWSDLNAGKAITLGTDSMHYMENNQTLVATYSGKVLRRGDQLIPNVTDKMLLIPQVTGSEKMKADHPQLDGPGEYLVVSRALVDMSGKTCDKIGATYSTFALQKDRCERPPGTCLTNQPIQLWERDRRSGGQHRFRLAGYGIPNGDAIEVNRASGEYLLLMKHTAPYTSYVDVEVDADNIGILRTGLHAQITNVYTMSGERVTLVTVIVTNTGLVSSPFSVQIASCSHKVPDSARVPFTIPPQNQMTFNLTLSHGTEIIRDKIVCSTLVRNSEHKIVAARRIHAYPHDRCVCVWFCLCACTAERFACTPMSLVHYRSSGFLGSIPTINKSALPYITEIVLDIELVLITLTILGLLMGCLKAVLGVMFPDTIGLFGLAMCNDKPRTIKHYYEHELRHFPVVYDHQGYPVHPLTKTATVRRISSTLEFCLNLAWFFYIPLAFWYWVRTRQGCFPETVSTLCCCPRIQEGSPRSQSMRQSLVSGASGSIPMDSSERNAQSYGGTSSNDIVLDQYRSSRDQLRVGSQASMGGTSGSRTQTRTSARSLSRSSLALSSTSPGSSPTQRRSTSSALASSSAATRSLVGSTPSISASGRRLSQMQGVPPKQ